MSIELPDWLRGSLLLGQDGGGDVRAILVDDAGQLNILMRGDDGTGTVRTVKVDPSGQLFTILRGAAGVDVAVDADGFLTTVLKGVFAGDLHTIAVDVNGRIEAFMLEAESQWGQVQRVGNADLAGRLGSPVTWDWRGNVLYLHDFSTGYGPVLPATSGAGASVAITPVYAGFGGYCLKMTAGSSLSVYSRIQLSVGANPGPRIGCAMRFSIDTNTNYVQLMLERMKGAGSPWAFIQIDVANQQMQVLDTTPAWQNVGAIPVNLAAFTYNWLKLVINQDTGYYERVMYNDLEFDLSAWQYPTIVSVATGSVLTQFTNFGRSGFNDIVYLDEIILTINEPENA